MLSGGRYFCILYNVEEGNRGSCLPSEEEVLIIRQTGKEGSIALNPHSPQVRGACPEANLELRN
jgi:hypothetical protein